MHLVLQVSYFAFRSMGSNFYGYSVPWRKYVTEEDNYIVLKSQSLTRPIEHSKLETEVMSRYRISLWNNLLPKIVNISTPSTSNRKNGIKGMPLSTGTRKVHFNLRNVFL